MDGKYFTCEVHKKHFQTVDALKEHVFLHHSKEEQFQCQECNVHFETELEFKLHKKKHKMNLKIDENPSLSKSNCKVQNKNESNKITTQKQQSQESTIIVTNIKIEEIAQIAYQCHICSGFFSGEIKLNEHLLSHLQDLPLLSPISTETKTIKTDVFIEEIENTGEVEVEVKPKLVETENFESSKKSFTFSCETCYRAFRFRKALNDHLKTYHTAVNLVFNCNLCKKTFNTRLARNKHISKDHPEPNSSSNEDEDYIPEKESDGQEDDEDDSEVEDTASLVSEDDSKSDNGSSFSVDYDNARKKRSTTIKTNSIQHTEIKISNYRCYFCSKTWDSWRDLERHTYTHTLEKVSHCYECRRSYHHSSDLKRHMVYHTKLRPHKCNICKNHFQEIRTLKLHMLTHSDERPNPCNQCKKAYKRPADLRRHKETAHSSKIPFKCEICSKGFKRKDLWNLHKRTRHSKC